MKKTAFLWLGAFGLLGCADSFPLPDEFDAAYTTGTVCAPAAVRAASADDKYPLRFNFCLYRCVSIEPGTVKLQTAYQCAGGQCQMTMLMTAHVLRVKTEEGCDTAKLVDPPADECKPTTIDFQASVPSNASGPLPGNYVVTLPYLELEEGQKVIDRIDAGENPATVLEEEVGPQNYPTRQFSMNVAADNPAVTELTDADCHAIGVP